MLPDGWSTKELGSVIEFINGYAFKPEEWSDDGTPIIRIQNLNGGGDFNYFQGTIPERYHVKNGDLLFCWSGSRGTSFGARVWRGELGYLNQHIFRCVVSDNLDPDFAFFLLEGMTSFIEKEAHGGGGLVHIKKSEIVKFSASFPPLLEQKRIAEVLGSVDAAIEATKAVIDQSKTVKRGLLQTLLTRGIGHTKFKDSRLGEIPESWELKTIGDVLDSCVYGISKSLTSEPIGTPILRMGNLQDDKLVLNGFKYADLSNEKSDQVFLSRGDIVFNRTNSLDLVGKVALVETDMPLGYASYLLRLRTNRTNSSGWLFRVMSSPSLQTTFRDIATRGASQVNINPTKMRALEIAVPPLAEQEKINEVFEVIDANLASETQKLATLQTLKKGLMDDLLMGKVRVSQLKVETANNVIPFTRSTITLPQAASLSPERLHAVIMAEVVYQLLDRPDFGSKKRQKITDLAIRLAGLDMETNLQATRAAAEPYDHASRHAAEEIFHREQWFTWREMPSRQIRYFRGASFGAHRNDYNQLPESTKESIQRTIDLLKDETPQKAEIIDTAFVAWNDLILSGNPEPTNQQIVDEVLGWHPDKSKISNAGWVAGIRWIRDKNICPTGTGVSTRERQLSLL